MSDERRRLSGRVCLWAGIIGAVQGVVLAADVSKSASSWSDITGLTAAVLNGRAYGFKACLIYEASSTSGGSGMTIMARIASSPIGTPMPRSNSSRNGGRETATCAGPAIAYSFTLRPSDSTAGSITGSWLRSGSSVPLGM